MVLDSVQHLDDGARAFLAATSVFRGGFTLQAAEQVTGSGAATLGILTLVNCIGVKAGSNKLLTATT